MNNPLSLGKHFFSFFTLTRTNFNSKTNEASHYIRTLLFASFYLVNKKDEKDERENEKLGWKDILAFSLAILQTVLLPFLIFIGVLVIIVLLLMIEF